MAGDKRPRILFTGRPLEHRFGQVTRLGRQGSEWTEQQRVDRRLAEADEQQPDHDRGGDDPADEAAYVFDGEMWVRNFSRPNCRPIR